MTSRAARGAAFGLGVLTFINLFNYLDRYIVAGVMSRVLEEFALSKDQGGLLGTVFILVYMLASPVGGYLGDRVPRRLIIAGGVMLWSLATVASGLAGSFAALLVARAVIGIGEAGYGTVAPAVISDLYPMRQRTRVLSYFYVAIPVGAALGFGVGGWVGEAWSWRAAFFVGGVPGIALAIATLFMPEPRRGAMDEGAADEKLPFRAGLKGLWRNRVFWPTTAGYTLVTFAMGGLAYWMPSFLELERGMSGATAGIASGAITALAGILGTLAGGFLGDWADRKRAGGGLAITGVGVILGAPLLFLAANARAPAAIFALLFASQFLLFVNSGPINAAVVNCVPATFRAFAMGLNVLLIHLLGDAISPPLIGLAAERASLEVATELNTLPILAGGVVLLFASSRAARAGRRQLPQPPEHRHLPGT